MSYCPKCGNKVDENMVFCPRCGAALKATSSTTPPPYQPYQRRQEKGEKNEKNEKNEKQEKNEDREKAEKGERGFVGYLIGGLILITFGVFFALQAMGSPWLASGMGLPVMLVIIGIIIIIGAIYVTVIARRHSPRPA